jgi:salicylate hydroxylase
MPPPPEFSQPPSKPFNVAVVGGGIAGLTLTLALLKQRVPVTLYEAAHQFGEIGAGVSFGPNAQEAMKLISPHIYEAFDRVSTRNQWESHYETWFDFRYGESCGGKRKVGEKIYTLNCGVGQTSVHRAHYLDQMVELLPEGIARFNKRLVDYRQDEKGVVLKFQDGSEARHDALIGTDGIKSRCRQIMLGENSPAAKAVFSGKIAYRGLIPMEQAVGLLGEEYAKNSQMYVGLEGHILTFCIEKGKTMNGELNLVA